MFAEASVVIIPLYVNHTISPVYAVNFCSEICQLRFSGKIIGKVGGSREGGECTYMVKGPDRRSKAGQVFQRSMLGQACLPRAKALC